MGTYGHGHDEESGPKTRRPAAPRQEPRESESPGVPGHSTGGGGRLGDTLPVGRRIGTAAAITSGFASMLPENAEVDQWQDNDPADARM